MAHLVQKVAVPLHRNCEGWLHSLKINTVYSLACSTFATSKMTKRKEPNLNYERKTQI